MFLPLTRNEIRKILELQLRGFEKMLGKQGMVIKLSDKSKDYLADLGYDPQFGARPLKRVIQKELVNELSKEVLSGDFGAGDTIYVGCDSKGLIFSKKPISKEATAQKKSPDTKASKRIKEVDKLKKATKDVKDALKDLDVDPPSAN